MSEEYDYYLVEVAKKKILHGSLYQSSKRRKSDLSRQKID